MIVFTRLLLSTRVYSTIAKAMEHHGIVPEVVDVAPLLAADVNYPSGATVQFGNELTPTEVKDAPEVTWKVSKAQFYTLCMTDPDAPSRKKPTFREWQHWLVGNIPGGDIELGEVLSDYIGAAPPKGTGFHRYIFLIYKQNGMIKFEEKRLSSKSAANRGGFAVGKFAMKYKLGRPIAGNFFQAQWDKYVPILYKKLGL